MDLIGNKLAVVFDQKDKTEYDLGNGIKLIRAEAWEHSEGTEEQHKLVNENVNKIDVNPQIATVLVSGQDSFFLNGDRIFTHYMAYENMDMMELEGSDVSVIDTDLVIFKIIDGEIVLPDGYFLGEQIMETELTTDYGLILNVVEKKKALTVKITHASNKESQIKVNDVIQSIDDFNYPLTYMNKNYIFIKEEEIVAKLV